MSIYTCTCTCTYCPFIHPVLISLPLDMSTCAHSSTYMCVRDISPFKCLLTHVHVLSIHPPCLISLPLNVYLCPFIHPWLMSLPSDVHLSPLIHPCLLCLPPGCLPVCSADVVYRELCEAQRSLVLSTNLHLLFLATPTSHTPSIYPNWLVFFQTVEWHCTTMYIGLHCNPSAPYLLMIY